MRRLYIILCTVVSVAVFASCGRNGDSHSEVEGAVEDSAAADDFLPLDSLRCVEGKVKNGQFFSTLLHSLGMSQQEAYNLTEACDSVFDVKTLRVGNGYQAYYDSSSLEYLVYERDKASNVVFACQPPYDAWVYEKPICRCDYQYIIVERYAGGGCFSSSDCQPF